MKTTINNSLIKVYLSSFILLMGFMAPQVNAQRDAVGDLVVEFLQPTNFTTFTEGDRPQITVAANQRNGSIRDVSLFFDGALVRTERRAPYEWGIGSVSNIANDFSDLTAGTHSIRVVARADNGATETITFDFEVQADNPADNPVSEVTLTEEQVDRDVIRFLTQSTFGANEATYNELRAQIDDDGDNRLEVYEDWIDDQLALPPTSMLDLVDGILSSNVITFIRKDERARSFWTLAVNSPDQLRHRLAQSLSEILVVSDEVTSIYLTWRGTADYWDMLASSGTGTYKDLLEGISRHTTMGVYLSHIQNVPANPATGSFPDENYAREVMQLFSMGLVKLNQDGSLILDGNGDPIPTYDMDVISDMARVFTGLNHSQLVAGGPVNTNFNTTVETQAGNHVRFMAPMRFFANRHDFGEKVLFTDRGQQVVLPARGASEAQADQELDEVMAALVAHSSTAPRLSRLLIQQLVTSNPSPDYIERVANAFGEEGDMRATIKAILLDPEARDPNVIDDEEFGKQKSPILHATSLLRLTGVTSQFYLDGRNNDLTFRNADRFPANAAYLRMNPFSSQVRSLSAESAFNFYSPDFAPPSAAFMDNDLVAPETQVLLEASQVNTINDIFRLIRDGALVTNQANRFRPTQDQQRVRLNLARAQQIWDDTPGFAFAKASALVDHLDFFYNAGQIQLSSDVSNTRAAIIEAVRTAPANERLSIALYGIASAPESMIQK